MQFPVDVPGFEGRNLVVETSAWSTPKLLVDGRPAPRGPKRNQYAIKPNNSNHEVLVELKTTFPDSIPVVYANGNEYRIAEPLSQIALIWAVVPLLLLFVGVVTGGMLLGGILGGLATAANIQAMRSNLSIPTRYIISGIFSFAALMFWLTINMSLNGTLYPSSTQVSVPAAPETVVTANSVTTPTSGFGTSGEAISAN